MPVKPELLRAILRAAVSSGLAVRRAGHGQVPDGHLRRLAHAPPHRARCAPRRASRRSPCMPAPAEQHYAGEARWDAIGELKAAVGTIPVLGNGDIWEADDAVRDDGRDRMRRRGDRARLPRPAVAVRRPRRGASRPARARRPPLGEVDRGHGRPRPAARRAHGRERIAVRDFRKHTGVVHDRLSGRARDAPPVRQVASLGRARRPARRARPDRSVVPGGERIRRGHTNGPIRVGLPDGGSTTSSDCSTTSRCPTTTT